MNAEKPALLLEKDGPVAIVTNNDAPMNRMTLEFIDALEDVIEQLEQDKTADGDSPWQIATEAGFHPVFDAGVERLMMVVGSDKTEQLSASELWEKSTPRYVKEHYSPNAGIESMLSCIRSARNQ